MLLDALLRANVLMVLLFQRLTECGPVSSAKPLSLKCLKPDYRLVIIPAPGWGGCLMVFFGVGEKIDFGGNE